MSGDTNKMFCQQTKLMGTGTVKMQCQSNTRSYGDALRDITTQSEWAAATRTFLVHEAQVFIEEPLKFQLRRLGWFQVSRASLPDVAFFSRQSGPRLLQGRRP